MNPPQAGEQPDPSMAYVPAGKHLHLYLETEDARALAAAIAAKGVPLAKPVHDMPLGRCEFAIHDDQGHALYFGERI